MSEYRLFYKSAAVRDIKKLSRPIQKRIKTKLEWFMQTDNPLHFAERLTKPADAQYRYRVGVFRILFDVDKDSIIILRVQHRSEVYK